jgi:hypothetical protein
MKEHGKIFNATMVKALLAGRKTQTRRTIKGAPTAADGEWFCDRVGPTGWQFTAAGGSPRIPCTPPNAVGDWLWVRETTRAEELEDGQDGIRYLADNTFRPIENTKEAMEAWIEVFAYRGGRGLTVPAIHMRRRFCRILLLVKQVRIERLQDITEADAIAEGVEVMPYDGAEPQYQGMFGYKDYRDHPHAIVPFKSALRSYETLWEAINGPGSWDANPWVSATTFTVEALP